MSGLKMDALSKKMDIFAASRTVMSHSSLLPPLSSQVSAHRYFHLDPTLPTDEISVICGGREDCDPDYLMDRAGFPCYGLEFVAEGRGELLLDGHFHPLRAGVAFFYGPGIAHRISNSSGHPMTKYFVNFSGSRAEEILRDSGLLPGRALQTLQSASIRSLIEQMMAEGAEAGANCNELCALYLRAIILKLARDILPSPSAVADQMPQFHQWREFIDLNFRELRDLEGIAAALHVRPAQLCRVFQRYGQSGPFRYLTRRKMNHAAGLLVTTSAPVKEVADAVGYPDPYHFSRLFKKHFGHSPREYAKIYRRTGQVS
jgi:AraC-like DNA-binding protein